jgi:aminoglycoside phosphotransferase (APT) family kinase protein
MVEDLIGTICQREGLRPRVIQPLSGGQVNQVYRIDEEYVLRIGAREDAYQRLKHETELMRSLQNEIPVPKIFAFGEQDDRAYQIQQFISGQKLYAVWKDLLPVVQENIAAELASYLKILHSRIAPHFGPVSEDTRPYDSWTGYLTEKFTHTLEEIDAYHLRMVPGFVELAQDYFAQHRHVLQDAVPTLVHGDLSFVNILIHDGKIAALLDFEYAMQAPKDYELWVIEDFCLYPNDYAEEDNEVFCTGDFAGFLPLLRKHDPELFEIPHLRQRMDLYHLEGTLSSHVAWRKANLSTKPADTMAAKEFYLARISNIIFHHGTRLF